MATAAAPGAWIPGLSGFCVRNDRHVNEGSLNLEEVFILWYLAQRRDESLGETNKATNAGGPVLTRVRSL